MIEILIPKIINKIYIYIYIKIKNNSFLSVNIDRITLKLSRW